MNKKLGGSVAALAVALAVVGYMSNRHQAGSIATVKPTISKPAPPATPPQKPVYEPEKDGEVFKTLKGKDFTAKVIISGDLHRELSVDMDNGTPVTFIRSVAGTDTPLEDNVVPAGYAYELKQVLPGEPREQIVCDGGELLPRGEGMLDTYSVYRVEGDHLQELINVITNRDVEEGNGPAPKQLKATLELSTRDGQPAYIYRVKAETRSEQTIVFRWNGKIFEDTSGAYRAIADEYNP
jgi:hypothetical protein